SVHPYLFAGPSIGFLLRNKEVVSSYLTHFFPGIWIHDSTAIDTTADITDSTARVELSIIAGGGISFNFESGIQLFVEAGYAFGLTNIDHYPSDEQYDDYIYSRDIRLAAGILFPLN
ncbi:MAG TPA: outer membrane beta-barrel protein, partial [Candidatus Kapabacteria bacterium]|nr:outer membrane beta-barrel protein [Candidatus Kapabacteria bacterium]